jgi:hypothetical protein
LIRHVQCDLAPPGGTNWGYYCDPEMDKLLGEVRNAFDPAEQTRLLAESAREIRRRRTVPDGDPRRKPARRQPEGEGFRSGAELVPGFLSDLDGQMISSADFADASCPRLSRVSTPC